MTRRRLTLTLLVLAVLAVTPSTAAAANTRVIPHFGTGDIDATPQGYTTNGRQALAIAERTKAARDIKRRYPGLRIVIFARNNLWAVDYITGEKTRLEVNLTPAGRVNHIWTGVAAFAYYARGGYGGLLRNPLVFLPFGLLFLLPFFDPKRPFRMLHLDMLVLLLGFGASFDLFSNAHGEAGILLVYPVLIYLLARMLMIGFGKTKSAGRVVPLVPTAILVIGIVVMTGARIGLNIAQDDVIDVGYASVQGADRVTHRLPLYVDNENHYDTYGPLTYVAYVPFELIFPTNGTWDSLPAAHAATIFFDLMTMLGLFLLGRRWRAGPEGTRLGLGLAWAWAAFPFTLWNVLENTNDGLVAMLLVYTLLALGSPSARGALVGAATAAKFMPGVLLPLIAVGAVGERRSWRDAARSAATAGGIFAFAVLVYLPSGGVNEFWNCTLGFQLSREADFSLWGVTDYVPWTQNLVLVAALALAVFVAFFPRRRTALQVAALTGAVSIAIQIPAGHWAYAYIPWFAPAVFVAILAGLTQADKPDEPRREVEPDFPTHRFAADLTAR